MRAYLTALSVAALLAVTIASGTTNAQNLPASPQFKMAQADEEVVVKKKVTPYGTKKIVKRRMGGEDGMGCKKVSVTKSNEMGDSVKKSRTTCG